MPVYPVKNTTTIKISKNDHYQNSQNNTLGMNENDIVNIGLSYFSAQNKKNNRAIARMIKKLFEPYSTIKKVSREDGAVRLTMNPIKRFKTKK